VKFQFQSLADLIYMSGHGPYVWACYGIGLLVVAYLLISPVRQKKKFMRQLRSQYARQAASGRVDSAP
jgi:heme exporter protein D